MHDITTIRRTLLVAGAAGACLVAGLPAASPAPAPAAAAAPATAATGTAACSTDGQTYGSVKLTSQLPDAAERTARQVSTDAQDCDARALVWRSTRDRTSLSFGLETPSQAWATPDRDGRYDATATVLGLKWATEPVGRWTYRVWPRVATARYAKDPAAWQELEDSGLYTADQVAMMRQSGSYYGYRVKVSDGGKLKVAIAGD